MHLLVVDIFPPTKFDPSGVHGAILEQLEDAGDPYHLPAQEPLTLASYVADRPVEAYLEHLNVGAPLPPMPLFLDPDRYVNAPLEETYSAAYHGVPAVWRDVIEGRGTSATS